MYHKAKPNEHAAAREGQWQEDLSRRAINGSQLWRCWACDSLSPWTNDHRYYASYREEEDGIPFPVMCSDVCERILQNKNIVPRRKVCA